jgi:hypothetical protein
VLKMQNLSAVVAPYEGVAWESLFASRHRHHDGTESSVYVINEHFMALLDFYVACALDAGQGIKHEKMGLYRSQVAMYQALSATGRDWRAELLACLKHWEPAFSQLLRRKRRRLGEAPRAEQAQVDPRLL